MLILVRMHSQNVELTCNVATGISSNRRYHRQNGCLPTTADRMFKCELPKLHTRLIGSPWEQQLRYKILRDLHESRTREYKWLRVTLRLPNCLIFRRKLRSITIWCVKFVGDVSHTTNTVCFTTERNKLFKNSTISNDQATKHSDDM